MSTATDKLRRVKVGVARRPARAAATPAATVDLKRILVVDDDARLRNLLSRSLIKHGYSASTAESAEAALDLVRYVDYDLIFCDLVLGGRSGLEFVEQVRVTFPELPVVLITAHGDVDVARCAIRGGATDFVTKPFDIALAPVIVERNLERSSAERRRRQGADETVRYSTVEALAAAIDAKEPYTAEHSRRVAALSLAIAGRIQLPEDQTQALELAARVHDVGKIGTPDYILGKPGPLTAVEWGIMRNHPGEGAAIVGRVEQLSYVAEIILHHHEWMDGTGYPTGAAGDDIPLPARVIAVADAYEVMTSDRVYRESVSHGQALDEIRRTAGAQFDAAVANALWSLGPAPLSAA